MHSGRPGQTLVGALRLRLGLDLDLDWKVGLRLEVGVSLWFNLLLLLQEDLVVQKLELSWVPVGQSKNQLELETSHYTW